MKRFIIFLVLPFLSGCTTSPDHGPDNDSKFFIEVTVENGSEYASKIDEVSVGVVNVLGKELNDILEIIAEASYGNGKFSLELPQKIDEKFLSSLETIFITDGKEIQISDRTAKAAAVVIFAKKSEQNVGIIHRYNVDITSIYSGITTIEGLDKLKDLYATGIYSTIYMYANKPATIKGVSILNEFEGYEIDPYTYKYNLTLKTGWNKCTFKSVATWTDEWQVEEGTIEVTNNEPAGMKWYYVDTSQSDDGYIFL